MSEATGSGGARVREREGEDGGGWLDRAMLGLSGAAALFLVFLAGCLVMLFDVFPAQHVTDAYRAGRALYERETGYLSPFQTNLWQTARDERQGVTAHDPARALDGYTLYTSGHRQSAFLVGMDGTLLHEWHLPYSKIWQEGGAIAEPQPDDLIYFRRAEPLPNGDLVFIHIALGVSPWGYSISKIDGDSNLLWTQPDLQFHHDLDIGADGRIYTLSHEIVDTPAPDHLNFLKPPRIDDFAVVLSPEGEILKKVSILDAITRSTFFRVMLQAPRTEYKGDFLHANSIEVIEGEAAANSPFEAGQVIVSLREINGIAVLDLETEEVVWATQGPWMKQHDADVLDNGNVLLFDNYGSHTGDGMSRVIEFDPETMEIVWSWGDKPGQYLASPLRSAQQRLPNGNTLITESDGSRLLEVAPDGALVWEYVNPVRGGEDDRFVPSVSWGLRFERSDFDPDFLASLAR